MKNKDIMNIEEVAFYLNVSIKWIRVNMHKQNIPYFRVRNEKLIRFKKSDIDNFINSKLTTKRYLYKNYN